MDSACRPHDLLWISDLDGLLVLPPLPHWASADWLLRAPLVVRREDTGAGAPVPVGLRGSARNARCAGYLARQAIARRVTPEMLAHAPLAPAARAGAVPAALTTLAALAPRLDATGLAWGPSGGAGFMLASGLPVLRPDSDLDLLVRAPRRLNGEQTAALLALQAGAGCRLDIQIDTGAGGFALAEWAARRTSILLKTGAGPVLTDDPWRGAGDR